MSTITQDIKYGIRLLAKSPGFTAVAVVSLALGIGANTTIFTIVNAVFFQSLGIPEESRVMTVFGVDQKNARSVLGALGPVSRLNFDDYRAKSTMFEGLVSTQGVGLNLASGAGDPEQVFGIMVTGNYFDVLGVKPLLGRTFVPDEDSTPGAHPVIVLSAGLWKTRFASDPNIINKQITVNGRPFAVIGVMPESFHGIAALGGPSAWIPRAMHDQLLTGTLREWFDNRRALTTQPFGRLKPGVTRQQAEAELKSIGQQLEKDYPKENEKRSVTLMSLSESAIPPQQRGVFTRAGALLMTVAAIVLLIACANLANLLLARAASRQREVAIRLSLGAGKTRLLRQLLTESMILVLIGGAAGLLVGSWGRDLIWSLRPPFFGPNQVTLPLDRNVLVFTFAVSVITGLLFGLAPALQASKAHLVSALKEQSNNPSRLSRMFGIRNILVVGQVGLSLIALIGAGLFLQSIGNAQKIDPGFASQKLAVMSFDIGSQGADQTRGLEFFRQTVERTKSVPGVESATVASNAPFGGGLMRTVLVDNPDRVRSESGTLVMVDMIGTGYFQTVGTPVLRGRDFSEIDRDGAPPVAIINETMAKRFWPDQDAIGKTFKFFGMESPFQVVGVAKDSNYFRIGEDPIPFLYVPVRQMYSSNMTLYIRTTGDPASVIPTVRKEIRSLEPTLPLIGVQTVPEVINRNLWAPKMGASLLATFGFLALILAAVGIYGVMSYMVTQRSREIGIRMALGAKKGDVLRMVLRHGLTLVLAGVGSGLLGAYFLSRAVSGLLFGVSATDFPTYAGVSLLLALVAMFASFIPARRGAHVDPIIALRFE